MGQVKDSTEIEKKNLLLYDGYELFPIDSDPGRRTRAIKEWLYGSSGKRNTLLSNLSAIWRTLRDIGKRIDDLEYRVSKLDGEVDPRTIPRPPNVAEYYIKQFLPDESE
jgi:hypothetical protein